MARIQGADTSPELALRRELFSRGVRYRLRKRLPFGRPDLVFPGRLLAVFVDGCFWHGCPAHYVAPKSSIEFWDEKLRTNIERDRRQTRAAEAAGWRVLRIWEHEVEDDVRSAADRVIQAMELFAVQQDHWQVRRVMDRAARERRVLVELRDPRFCERVVPAPCNADGLPVFRRRRN